LAADLDSWAAQVAALWPWEAVAVVLAVAYLVLAIRESVWCWAAGMASSAVYLGLFFDAGLYMESALQLFYIGISIYGWMHWSRPAAALPVVTWTLARHASLLGLIAVLAVLNGALLAAFTPAALPYLDSLIAWGSVITTWMVARKVLENWLYWFIIDSLSAYIYARRGLWLTAGLFACYLPLIVIGYRAWRRPLRLTPA
jgi:nicotinamide mononucleotide transporter